MKKNITSSPQSATSGRKKTTSRFVILADRLADRIITIGGILVIFVVLGIMVFLVKETYPLFVGGIETDTHNYSVPRPDSEILTMGLDDNKTMACILLKNGLARIFHAKTGVPLTPPILSFKNKISSFGGSIDQNHIAFGFADGTVRTAQVEFESQVVALENLPQNLKKLDKRDSTDGLSVFSQIPGNQYRKVTFKITTQDPVKVSPSDNAIIALDYRVGGETEKKIQVFAAVDKDQNIILSKIKSRVNLLTGKRRVTVKTISLPKLPDNLQVHSVLLTEKADMVLVADKDGTVYRFNAHNFKSPFLAETTRLLSSDNQLTIIGFLAGEQSLVVGGTDSSLNIYFLTHNNTGKTLDGKSLVKARSYNIGRSPATEFTPVQRGKSFAFARKNGEASVIHATSEKTLLDFSIGENIKSAGIALTPRVDGLLTICDNGNVILKEFLAPHPEITFSTLFKKVWYEGYPEPTYTWQSSAGSDDYEPKLSLIPLIFGSVKAAFYSLLFAVPIAILGAIYTSEFLGVKTKNIIKPTMELMASIPSVVLGFIAALILAPLVETWIAAVLVTFVVVPVFLVIGSLLWQLLPQHIALQLDGTPKIMLIALTVVAALFAAENFGRLFEQLFFSGNFKAWVNHDIGDGRGLLFLMAMPLSMTFTSLFMFGYLRNFLARLTSGFTQVQAAIFDIVKLLFIAVIAAFISFGIAWIADILGLDARNGILGAYVQRNTLIVGFAMGFAVIPIIYTIAEDALTAVPNHLRAASLGCGATPWQTAIWIVMPTAASGIFSAIMIGMGRAVGETMIVVMAAGNTPLLDWNIFNGLRALSATIAVELPEAVKEGTLYRVLFLAGLVLFAITFVINTIAELVRLKYRKQTAML